MILEKFLRVKHLVDCLGAISRNRCATLFGESKPRGFQTGGFPTFFGKGGDCVADPFGTVPRRWF